MKVNQNQTALDVALSNAGSIYGLPLLLNQLPVGERIGLADVPDLDDVDDIGQTWTPNLQGMELDATLDIYIDETLVKAPFGTDLETLEPSILWGETLLPALFDYTGYIEYDVLPNVVPNESKHYVNENQTIVDVTLDLSGSLKAVYDVLNQLPTVERIGLSELPNVWEDTTELSQTWTPDVEKQYFELSVTLYNETAKRKRRFNTNIVELSYAISWGNMFLQEVADTEYLTDDFVINLEDDFNTYLTT